MSAQSDMAAAGNAAAGAVHKGAARSIRANASKNKVSSFIALSLRNGTASASHLRARLAIT